MISRVIFKGRESKILFKKRILLTTVTTLFVAFQSFGQITVNGNLDEWGGTASTTANTWELSQNSAGTTTKINEFIWTDADDDHRTDDFGSFIDPSKQDLREFRIASNSTDLYFAATFEANIDKPFENGGLQLQISIRRASSSSTTDFLPRLADAQVPSGSSPGGGVPNA